MKNNVIKKWLSIILSLIMALIVIYVVSIPFLAIGLIIVSHVSGNGLFSVFLIVTLFSLPMIIVGYNFYKTSTQALDVLISKNLLDEAVLLESIEPTKQNENEINEKIRIAFLKVNTKDFYVPSLKIYRANNQVFNAFAISNLKENAIIVFDGLAMNTTNEELRAVIGHELCHIKNKDSLYKLLLFSTQYSVAHIKFIGDNIATTLHNTMLQFRNFFISLITLAIYYVVKTLFLAVDMIMFCNKFLIFYTFKQNEYLADNHAVSTSSLKGMLDVLEKINIYENQNNNNQSTILYALFSEHPQTVDRIKNLKN